MGWTPLRFTAGFQSCTSDPSQGRPAQMSVLEISGMVGCGEIPGCAPLWREGRASCNSDRWCRGARRAPSSPCPAAHPGAAQQPVKCLQSTRRESGPCSQGQWGRRWEAQAGSKGAAMVVGPGAEPGEGETMGWRADPSSIFLG